MNAPPPEGGALTGFLAHEEAGNNDWNTPSGYDLFRSMKFFAAGTHSGFSDLGFTSQRETTRGYVHAYLRAHLKSDWSYYEDYIRGDAIPDDFEPVFSQYSDPTARRVVDNAERASLSPSSIGDVVTTSGNSGVKTFVSLRPIERRIYYTSNERRAGCPILYFRPPILEGQDKSNGRYRRGILPVQAQSCLDGLAPEVFGSRAERRIKARRAALRCAPARPSMSHARQVCEGDDRGDRRWPAKDRRHAMTRGRLAQRDRGARRPVAAARRHTARGRRGRRGGPRALGAR